MGRLLRRFRGKLPNDGWETLFGSKSTLDQRSTHRTRRRDLPRNTVLACMMKNTIRRPKRPSARRMELFRITATGVGRLVHYIHCTKAQLETINRQPDDVPFFLSDCFALVGATAT